MHTLDEILGGRSLGLSKEQRKRVQFHLQYCEILPQTIVQIPANLSSLLVLRPEQVLRQLTQRFFRGMQLPLGIASFRNLSFQFLLRVHFLCNVSSNFSKADQFAFAVSQGCDDYIRPKPRTVFSQDRKSV